MYVRRIQFKELILPVRVLHHYGMSLQKIVDVEKFKIQYLLNLIFSHSGPHIYFGILVFLR